MIAGKISFMWGLYSDFLASIYSSSGSLNSLIAFVRATASFWFAGRSTDFHQF